MYFAAVLLFAAIFVPVYVVSKQKKDINIIVANHTETQTTDIATNAATDAATDVATDASEYDVGRPMASNFRTEGEGPGLLTGLFNF